MQHQVFLAAGPPPDLRHPHRADGRELADPPNQCVAQGDRHRVGGPVERCINRLKNWRGLATRSEKTATVFRAGLHIAGIFIWSAR
ncbi:hypothetical protein GCM10010193_37420 [Kitasatospora atroaurantiaca]